MPLTLRVINLWAAPGVGKSTTAAGLFNLMKANGESVELVTEYAKDMVYEANSVALTNQLLVLASQDHRLRRLEGKATWAITDSPLPLSLIYMTPEYESWLPEAIWGAYDRYLNLDILLHRNPKRGYSEKGRLQTEEESIALDDPISEAYMAALEGDLSDPNAMGIRMDVTSPHAIYEWLKEREQDGFRV